MLYRQLDRSGLDRLHQPERLVETPGTGGEIMNASMFLVISYNIVEHKGIRDLIIAEDKEHALDFVARHRPEVQVVDCLDPADLAKHTRQMGDVRDVTKLLTDLEAIAGVHRKASDCTLDENKNCTVCGVSHGEPCPTCGGAGFHLEGCEEI
jgi:hypothetical protein